MQAHGGHDITAKARTCPGLSLRLHGHERSLQSAAASIYRTCSLHVGDLVHFKDYKKNISFLNYICGHAPPAKQKLSR